MTSSALFSDDRRYRYWLLRQWEPTKPMVAFIGLNPSVANEKDDDPTIRRCIGFAERWKYGGMLMMNLYAWCSTQPTRMWQRYAKGYDIAGGEQNSSSALMVYAHHYGTEQIIAAWGHDKLDRWRRLKTANWRLDCLKINTDAQPGHVLYLPYLAERQPWNY